MLEGENLVTTAKVDRHRAVGAGRACSTICGPTWCHIADRFETIATAVAAAYMNIPLAHVQGGEITGSIDEKVRHAVTKLADLHLVARRQARRARHPHGRGAGRSHVTGCPSIDSRPR